MISMQRGLGGVNDFGLMVGELGRAEAMRLLDVSRQQLTAWLKPDARVPRACVLALYWETRWGRSVIDRDRQAEIDLLRAQVRCLAETVGTLRARVKELEIECRSRARAAQSANDRWFSELPRRPRRDDRGHGGHQPPERCGSASAAQIV